MPVAQALARNRPCRHIRCSSSPSADTSEILSAPAASSAQPQRRTGAFTGCRLQPSSRAMSSWERPRPDWRVAQRPARAVSPSRSGAIRGSCSVTVPAARSGSPQRHRRLLHRPPRPAGRRQVHRLHPQIAVGAQPPAAGRTARPRRPTADTHPQRLPGVVVDAEHLHVAQPQHQLTRAQGLSSTGILQMLGCLAAPMLGDPSRSAADGQRPTPTSNAKRRFERGPCGMHNGRASKYCSSRKPRAPEGQSEDPVGSPRTGAGAHACMGRSAHVANFRHSEIPLQEAESRRLAVGEVLPDHAGEGVGVPQQGLGLRAPVVAEGCGRPLAEAVEDHGAVASVLTLAA